VADLEIRVRAEAQQAQAVLDRLTQSVNGVARSAAGLDSGIAQAERAMAGMGRSSLLAGQETERLDDALRETGQTATVAGGQVVTASESMKTALSAVAMAATQAIVVFLGFQKLAGMFSDTVRRLDELNESARSFGISGKTFSEFAYTLEQNGASVRDLEMGLRGLSNSLEEAGSDKGSKAARTFQEMGVSIRTMSGEMRPLDQIFLETVEGLSKIESASERVATAQDLLKVRNAALLTVIAQGKGAFDEGAAAASKYGAAISDDVLKAADQLSDEMRNLKALGASIFLPFIQGAAEAVKAINNVAVAIRNMSGGREDILGGGGGLIPDAEVNRLRGIFDSLPKSMQIEIEGLDHLEDRIRRLQSISVERRVRELPAEDQTKIREQVRTFKADESQLPRRVEEYRTRLVEEAEARLEKARRDAADAAIRAAAAEEARIRLLDAMAQQGSLEVTRPEFKWGTSERDAGMGPSPGLGGDYMDVLNRNNWNRYLEEQQRDVTIGPPDTFKGGITTGPGGIQTDEQRDSAIKEQQKLAEATKKAIEEYNKELSKQDGTLEMAEDAISSFVDVARALKNPVLEAAAAIAKLAIDIIQLVSSISGSGLAQSVFKSVTAGLPPAAQAGVGQAVGQEVPEQKTTPQSAPIVDRPRADKNTATPQFNSQFAAAIRAFEDSVDTFDTGTEVFRSAAVIGGSRPESPPASAASFAAPAGERPSRVDKSVVPSVDRSVTTQGAQFNRAIRNFEDSVDTFDAGTRIFQSTVVTGGKAATAVSGGMAAASSAPGGVGYGIAQTAASAVGGAAAGGLGFLGRMAGGLSFLGPLMALGSQAGGIADILTGNQKARADLERFAADFNRQVTMGGPDLADAYALQRRQGYIEEWTEVAPDHARSGGWKVKNDAPVTPLPQPEEPPQQRGTASVQINVSTLDSRSTAEFFKSDEYARALSYARMVKAAD